MKDQIESFVADDYAKVTAAVALATDEPKLAHDAVQSAVAKVASHPNRYEAFAARVAVVAAGDARLIARRRAIADRNAGLDKISATPTNEAVGDTVLHRALDAMPQRQREVALLHYYLGASPSAIADVMHINDNTVASHLDAARAVIIDHLQLAEVEEPELG